MDHRVIAEDIFREAVKSVLPQALIPSVLSVSGDNLSIGELIFPITSLKRLFLIGAGKATALMASESEKILGGLITEGHIIVKHGYSCKLKHIHVTEAGHPVPDSNGFRATGTILSIAAKAEEGDLVICLISGGGSALLADYPPGSSPEEMMVLNDLLVNSGACISEINAVRKHISLVKGGQLSRTVYPATLVSLILSDVPGDPVDVIASGPTSPDPTTFKDAIDVLIKYNLLHLIPGSIKKYLEDGREGHYPETPKPSDPVFERTHNILIGTNRLALQAARLKALEYNINALIIDTALQGDTASVAEYLVETALRYKTDEIEIKPVCLLFGGETTVKMTGRGLGGRNQHLSLLVSILLRDHPGITFLSGGTDGNDGPTNAAGAVVDSETYNLAVSKKILPKEYIKAFDSYNFFKKAGGQIITGPTMTNVMDIMVVLVI